MSEKYKICAKKMVAPVIQSPPSLLTITTMEQQKKKPKGKKKASTVVEMPSWLTSIYDKWEDRNNNLPPTETLTFAAYVVTCDDLAKVAKVTEKVDAEVKSLRDENNALKEQLSNSESEMVKMRRNQGKLVTDLEALFKAEMNALRTELGVKTKGEDVGGVHVKKDAKELKTGVSADVKDVIDDTRGLKEPRSEQAFDALRLVLYKFNKRNWIRSQEAPNTVKKWTKNGVMYDTIHNKDSLEAWFESEHASSYDLGPGVIEEFNVCVFRGELATISKEFEGGVGIEAFWLPNDKYDAHCVRSASYKSAESMLTDPRHGYMLSGVKWVPCSGVKKRKSVE